MGGLRIGLIGANPDVGWAAGTHLPAIAALEGMELVAACTRRAESARKAAELYGATHALTDPAALVGLPEVDLVVVSVRAPGHAALVELALEAGKPVLCEWPLGKSADESARLAAMAAAKGLPNFVCLQGFASPGALAMAELVGAAAVGEVLSVRAAGTFNVWGATVPQATRYLTDVGNGVSIASIYGGHALHMLARIAGGWKSFAGHSANRRTSVRLAETGEEIAQTSPDQFVAAGLLESGAPATVHLAGGVPGPGQFELVVQGANGALRLSTTAGPEILPPLLERAGEDGAFAPVEIAPRFCLAPESLGPGPAFNVAQLLAMVEAELGGGESRAPGFTEAAALRRRIAGTN